MTTRLQAKKKKCILILRGAVRVDYVTTGQKKSANWVKAEPEVREQQFHKTRLKKCLSTALVLEDLQPVGAAAP